MLRILFCFLLCVGTNAVAQDTIKIIQPFSPGGTVDVTARLLQQPLANYFQMPVVTEYKLGAGGAIGHSAVARSDPTKQIFGATTSSVIINTIIKADPGYQLEKLQAVAYLKMPFALVVSHTTNIQSFDDLKNYKRPINYGTLGHGSTTHIISEYLAKQLRQNWNHISYKGTPQVAQAIISQDIELSVIPLGRAFALAEESKVTLIAVDLPHRHPQWPKIPTFVELAELRPIVDVSYLIFIANIDMDTVKVKQMQTAIKTALQDPVLIEKLDANGLVVDHQRLIPVDNFMVKDRAKIQKLIKNLQLVEK